MLQIQASSEPLLDLVRFSIVAKKLSPPTAAVLKKIEIIWSSANDEAKKINTAQCRDAIAAVLVKFQKDKAIVELLNHGEADFVPSNKRHCESLFSTFKCQEKSFIAMDQSTLEWSVKAKINKLGVWLKKMTPKERELNIKKAKKGRYAIRISKAKEENDHRNFRLRHYSL